MRRCPGPWSRSFPAMVSMPPLIYCVWGGTLERSAGLARYALAFRPSTPQRSQSQRPTFWHGETPALGRGCFLCASATDLKCVETDKRETMMNALQTCLFKQSQRAVWTAVFIFAGLGVASAQIAPSVQRGTIFAEANCSRCHSIDKISASSLSLAPPFRDLHLRYAVEDLAESLAEGIGTGHSNMPEYRLDPGQIDDFINFLKSL
jgi:cytochrome c